MKVTKELEQTLKTLRRAIIREGIEFHNPTPVAIPIGMERPPTLKEQIQRVLRTELSQQAALQGQETFEEADDFDIPDEEPDPISEYEVKEMMEEPYYENPPSPSTDTPVEPNNQLPQGEDETQNPSPEATGTEGGSA